MSKQKSPTAYKKIKTVSYFYLLDKTKRTRPQLQVDLIKDYGEVVRLHHLLPYYVINHPDYIKHIFITNQQNYIKSDKSYKGLIDIIGEGIITNNGPRWKEQRINLASLFQPQKFTDYIPTMQAITQTALAKWGRYAANKQAFNLTHEIMTLTLKISAKNFLSVDLEEVFINRVIAFSKYMNSYVGKALYMLRQLPLPTILKLKKEKLAIETYLLDMVQKRRDMDTPPTDLLTQLLQMRNQHNEALSDAQILAELKNFLVASYETVAHALTWTWYHLIHHPEILEKAQTEIIEQSAQNNLQNLPYTKMVIEESMRLTPPAWVITRRALENDEIDGYRIPAKANLLICPYAIHRHPDYWQEPEKFIPERFSEENKKKIHRCSYLPFGAGPRTCIASHLALVEAQIILAGLLPHFNFKLDPRKKIRSQALITFGVKDGLWVFASEK